MTSPTATYEARSKNIDALIKRLEAARAGHAVRAEARPKDWGFAGDLGRAEELLTELVEGMGG